MNSWVDAVATVIVILALIVGGYFWLQSESEKIIQARHGHTQEKSSLEKYAPLSFEILNKRTE